MLTCVQCGLENKCHLRVFIPESWTESGPDSLRGGATAGGVFTGAIATNTSLDIQLTAEAIRAVHFGVTKPTLTELIMGSSGISASLMSLKVRRGGGVGHALRNLHSLSMSPNRWGG